jgi:hypothetical protein
MRTPPLELQVEQASVSELDSQGCAVINCQTSSGQQVLLRIGREALVLLCSAATRELKRNKRKLVRQAGIIERRPE